MSICLNIGEALEVRGAVSGLRFIGAQDEIGRSAVVETQGGEGEIFISRQAALNTLRSKRASGAATCRVRKNHWRFGDSSMQTPPSHEPSWSRLDKPSRATNTAPHQSLADLEDKSACERRQMLPGSLAALATPFEKDDIAEKSFADLVSWQIEQGSQGLVVCGATGEAPTLSPNERRLLIQIAVETAAGRVPIIVATGTNCTRETIALTQAAEAAGAAAALIVTPYYNKPNQEGLYRHYCEIAGAVRLPLIVENDPARTGIEIRPETLARLSVFSNIVGIEDVFFDLSRLSVHSLSVGPDFIRLSGDDSTSALFRMAGGHSSVSIIANIVPRLWTEMHQAISIGDWGRAASIQVQLQPLVAALQLETNPGPVKYALSLLHPWFTPTMRLPLITVSYETGCDIASALQDLKLLD
jgi:4-hydroxy-tetrahydrodipicolinate synthase